MQLPVVIIEVRGGVVQNVLSSCDINVVVFDYDEEGTFPELNIGEKLFVQDFDVWNDEESYIKDLIEEYTNV